MICFIASTTTPIRQFWHIEVYWSRNSPEILSLKYLLFWLGCNFQFIGELQIKNCYLIKQAIQWLLSNWLLLKKLNFNGENPIDICDLSESEEIEEE